MCFNLASGNCFIACTWEIKVIFQVLYNISLCSRKAESRYLSSLSVIEKYLHFFPHFSAFPVINIAGILPQCFQDYVIFHSQTEILKDKWAGLTCTLWRDGCSRRTSAVLCSAVAPSQHLLDCLCLQKSNRKFTPTTLTTLVMSNILMEQG